MSIQSLSTENFQQQVGEADVPVLIDFWSPACGPCRRMLPLLEELAAECEGRFRIFKVDVSEQPQLAARFQIYALPTVLIFRGGQTDEVLVGCKEKSVLLVALERGGALQRAAC